MEIRNAKTINLLKFCAVVYENPFQKYIILEHVSAIDFIEGIQASICLHHKGSLTCARTLM